MAKQKKENQKKLDLSTVLKSIDKRDMNFYDKLLDEEKKEYQPYVLMRFISSAPPDNQGDVYFLNMVNELVNTNFKQLSRHPDLVHRLLCSSGIGRSVQHQWIKPPMRKPGDKINDILKMVYDGINDDEVKIIRSGMTKTEIIELLQEHGYQDSEISGML